jgi:hypothetical protein
VALARQCKWFAHLVVCVRSNPLLASRSSCLADLRLPTLALAVIFNEALEKLEGVGAS